MTSSCRDIIRLLAARYQLTNDQIIEQIQDEFQDLKTWPSIKDKIEEWVIKWENLRGHIVRAGIMGLFGSDAIYIKEFLKAGRKWASDFCDSWVREHRAAGREVDFFHITREYRNEVEMTLKNARNGGHNQVNATLNGLDQVGQKSMDQASHSPGSGHKDDKFKGRKCVCDDVHLFKECPYIVTSARKPGWKENSTVREEARQRIMKNVRFLTVIKHITNTNILNGLKDQKDDKAKTDDDHFSFSGVAIMPQNEVVMPHKKNPLSNSVIYDSGCNQQLTYDKARFIGQITSASE
jgi:phage gp36-like protein